MIEQYSLHLLALGLVLLAAVEMAGHVKKKAEKSMVESLRLLAIDLASGSSVETAIQNRGSSRTMASRAYRKALANLAAGMKIKEALRKASKSTVFLSLADMLETPNQQTAGSMRSLADRIDQVMSLEEEVDAQLSFPVTLLQVLGIFLLPLFYIFLASILTDNVISVPITENLKLYLLGINLIMAFAPTILISQMKRSIYMLPLALSYYVLAFDKIGPYLITLI